MERRIRELHKTDEVISFIYEPGNMTRFDVVLTKLKNNNVLFTLTNFNESMIINLDSSKPGKGYIAEKMKTFRNYSSDLRELQTLIWEIYDRKWL